MSKIFSLTRIKANPLPNSARPAARSLMVDEFDSLIPGTVAYEYNTEAGARGAFKLAMEKGEVQTIRMERAYIFVE